MSAVIRQTLAALIALSVLAPSAVLAEAETNVRHQEASNAPVVVDVLVMRPVGFVSLVMGVGLFAVSTPLVIVTRPQEIHKPFKLLIVRPAKFLWSDPLGGH